MRLVAALPGCPSQVAQLALSLPAHRQPGRRSAEVVVLMHEVYSEAEEWPRDWERPASVCWFAIFEERRVRTSAVSLPRGRGSVEGRSRVAINGWSEV